MSRRTTIKNFDKAGSAPPIDEFELDALDGQQHSLGRLLEGRRGLVVVFWSSVCSHCQRYDPLLESFAQRFPAIGLVAIASRRGETTEQLRAAVAQRGLSFPLLLDADRQVARRWQVEQTPRAFLLDRARRPVYRGAIDNFKYPQDPAYEAYLEPAIADLLAGRSVARVETASFGCPIDSAYYDLPALRRG